MSPYKTRWMLVGLMILVIESSVAQQQVATLTRANDSMQAAVTKLLRSESPGTRG